MLANTRGGCPPFFTRACRALLPLVNARHTPVCFFFFFFSFADHHPFITCRPIATRCPSSCCPRPRLFMSPLITCCLCRAALATSSPPRCPVMLPLVTHCHAVLPLVTCRPIATHCPHRVAQAVHLLTDLGSVAEMEGVNKNRCNCKWCNFFIICIKFLCFLRQPTAKQVMGCTDPPVSSIYSSQT